MTQGSLFFFDEADNGCTADRAIQGGASGNNLGSKVGIVVTICYPKLNDDVDIDKWWFVLLL